MRVRPFLFGLAAFCALLAWVIFTAIFAEEISPYEKECGIPLREKLCFLDSNDVAECGLEEQRFDVLENRLADVFAFSPDQVKGKMCSIGAFVVAHPAIGIDPWVGAFTNNEVIGINLAVWQNIFTPYEIFQHGTLTGYLGDEEMQSLVNANKIRVKANQDSDFGLGPNYALANLIFHEVGHLIETDLSRSAFHCLSPSEQPSSLSFLEASEDHYCDKLLPKDQDQSLLSRLMESNYITPYATCTDAEDFAETYAAYLMSEYLGRNVIAYFDGQEIYNSEELLASKKLEHKINVVESIVSLGKLDDENKWKLRREHELCIGGFLPPNKR